LISESDGVRGELEDDFHHFQAEVRHRDGKVSSLEGRGMRVPWTTCPDALAALRQLQGRALSRSLRTLARGIDPQSQCTHVFDLATLAIAHASRGSQRRSYDISIPDRIHGRTRAWLGRDAQEFLCWELDGYVIAAPEPFQGRSIIDRSFGAWAESELDCDRAEAALVLRRACFISLGRRYDFAHVEDAASFGAVIGSACYTFSPQAVDRARPIHESAR
jgi:hypothetical protein